MDAVSLSIIAASFLVSWCIGANSTSNVISMLAGPRITSLKTATAVVCLLMLAGALLQSGAVIKTLSEDIVINEAHEQSKLVALSALLATAVFIWLMTFQAFPISSSHAIVGALVGSSIALQVTRDLNYELLKIIVLSWFLTPVMSLAIAYFTYKFLVIPLSKKISLAGFASTFKSLTLLATALAAYSLGANNIGNSISLVISSGAYANELAMILLGILAMTLGAISFSKKVVRNVAMNITMIDPPTAFTAQLSAGLVMLFFTVIGIPISITQAIMGGLTGIGITKGAGMVNNKLLMEIFIGWVVTPCIAGLLSIGIYEVLALFISA